MRLSRREFLASVLGWPFVLSGCARDDSPLLPPGELVGASDTVGHRLRDGLHAEVPADKWTSTPVVIVGGGVAGLSAARRLRKAGVEDFTLLELESAPGGTARSGRNSVVAYPWGAHYLPAPTHENPALVDLLDECGILEGRTDIGDPIVAEQFLCRVPQERVFYKGAWYEGLYVLADATDDDLRQFAAFQAEVRQWAEWRDGQGRRAFGVPMAMSSDDPYVTALDRLSMAEWMDRRRLTSPKLRWYVDYACRDDYGLRLHQTSAWAGLFYFAARLPGDGAESRPYITWPEGNGRLVRCLYEPIRNRVLLGWAVCEIVPQDDNGRTQVDVIAVSHDGTGIRGFHAERVIFAAPQFLARYLIRPWRHDPPPHITDFSYGAWTVANLTLHGRPVEHEEEPPLSWDNVIADSRSLGYVTATHQALLDYGPTVLTWYMPLCDDDPRMARQRLLDGGRDDWAAAALADLEVAHPGLRRLTDRIDVMRWGHAMIRPVPGFTWGQSRRQAAKPFRGIAFAHSDLSGVALFEEAFHRGTLAAETILADLGR